MRALAIPLVLALVVLGPACSGDTAPTEEEDEAVLMLPDACYGAWEFEGSGGGIHGRGAGGGPWERMVITRENAIETRTEDGGVWSLPFHVRRGKTIFSSEPGWFMTTEDGRELVVEVGPDGKLHLSQNVYDGFGFSYRPAQE